jgi:hypothetical protein
VDGLLIGENILKKTKEVIGDYSRDYCCQNFKCSPYNIIAVINIESF